MHKLRVILLADPRIAQLLFAFSVTDNHHHERFHVDTVDDAYDGSVQKSVSLETFARAAERTDFKAYEAKKVELTHSTHSK